MVGRQKIVQCIRIPGRFILIAAVVWNSIFLTFCIVMNIFYGLMHHLKKR